MQNYKSLSSKELETNFYFDFLNSRDSSSNEDDFSSDDCGVYGSDFDSALDSELDEEIELDSESEEEEEIYGRPPLKNENYFDETVALFDDEAFIKHFRVTRDVVNSLSYQYERSSYLKLYSGPSREITAMKQVLIFLWFAGHGEPFFRDLGKLFNISTFDLHQIIRRVCLFISNLSPDIITWPNEAEKIAIEEHFRKNGFPSVIGALGARPINIRKELKKVKRRGKYYCKKEYCSVQTQIVSDHQRKILDVFVGYPGDGPRHEAFENSPLFHELDQKCGNYYLLGNKSYPLRKNLLTPFNEREPLNQRQLNYNLKLKLNWYVVDHCLERLKRRFRRLYKVNLSDVIFSINFIRACCVLHNISLNDCFNRDENESFIEANIRLNNPDHRRRRHLRNSDSDEYVEDSDWYDSDEDSVCVNARHEIAARMT